MKPTIEEVKLKYANAEIVADAYTGEEFNINEYDLESIELGNYYTVNDYVIYGKKDRDYDKILYDEKKGYAKILTYKKPSFRPIAMKCNQEQFYAVKEKLWKWGLELKGIINYPYLTNDFNNKKELGFTLCTSEDFPERKTYETWNEKVFLEACGIVVEEPKEESFVITKEQILEFHKHGTFETKQQAVSWFPSAFVEDKKELILEFGKWYKRPHNKALFCIVGNPENEPFEVYGFDMDGNWMEPNKITDKKVQTFKDNEVEATPEEVKSALEKEAVKRGFVDGVRYNDVHTGSEHIVRNLQYCEDSNDVRADGCIFFKGKWATIIPTITKAEAEQKLNCKII